PSWATFDEDGEPDVPPGGTSPSTTPNSTTPNSTTPNSTTLDSTTLDSTALDSAAGEDAATRQAPLASTLLTEYDGMTLSRLRPKLRGFSWAQLEELLAHEQAHRNRAAFITLLSNRISSVRAQ